MSKSRKHGIFAVEGLAPSGINSFKELAKKQWFPISFCLKTVYNQMELSGNRPRTISRYDI
ncbi:MAG: hypothetical protein RR651_14655 [Lysinibacillus sp.]